MSMLDQRSVGRLARLLCAMLLLPDGFKSSTVFIFQLRVWRTGFESPNPKTRAFMRFDTSPGS